MNYVLFILKVIATIIIVANLLENIMYLILLAKLIDEKGK